MPFSNPNYNKLKTNLRLAMNRLKLLEKKKTETALKARKEIADYMAINKIDRAKIRVEHIIREDYMVEAMEIIEMLCDLLLARFGLIQQSNTMDEGLKEAIYSLVWVGPQLHADVPEMKIIADMLSLKYNLNAHGKEATVSSSKSASSQQKQQRPFISEVNEKLVQKMSVQAPPKILVEKYLIEISKSHNVPYTPDPLVIREEEIVDTEKQLLDFLNHNDDEDSNSGIGGNGDQKPPATTAAKNKVIGFNYPSLNSPTSSGGGPRPSAPGEPPHDLPPSYSEFEKNHDIHELKNPNSFDYIDLPNVPSSTLNTPAKPSTHSMANKNNYFGTESSNIEHSTLNQNENIPIGHDIARNADPNNNFAASTPYNFSEIDFDDLNKRFEELKKKK